MTITQYNSSLTPEFKWALFEKRNNLEELINKPTKAEERSLIQISFTGKMLDPNIKTGKHLQLIYDPQDLPDLPQKKTHLCAFEGQIRQFKNLFTPLLEEAGLPSG